MNTPGLDPRPARTDPTRLDALAGTAREALGAAVSLPDGAAGVTVTGLGLDSRTVRPGDLYAALPGGRTHGARFTGAAVQRGAVAVLTDTAGAAVDETAAAGVPVLVAERPRRLLGALAAQVYGRPADALRTLGVTGTQGKTTVTYLLESALAAAGHVPGVMGTTGTRVGGRPVASRLTTPEAPDLHALLAVMREQGVDCCALEVSSHALVQGRVDGVRFDVATFLNLGRDHLDFHRDMEDYFAAKASLFTPERSRRAVVDVGDAWGRRLAGEVAGPVTTLSAEPGTDADWRAAEVRPDPAGTDLVALGPGGLRLPLRVPLPGGFNVRNALAVVATLAEADVDLERAAAGLAASPGVPGRMERVEAGQQFAALVDYAHKPDALAAVLSALRPATAGRLLLVLGAGGERDPGKRPLMGEVAARMADLLVVTDDNPRHEDPATIRAELVAGAAGGPAEVVEVGDRSEAIRLVVERAHPGDTVLVAGKGHETGQEAGGVVHPFDDRAVLRAALAARAGAGAC